MDPDFWKITLLLRNNRHSFLTIYYKETIQFILKVYKLAKTSMGGGKGVFTPLKFKTALFTPL